MPNRDDAVTPVAGDLHHDSFESDPARRLAMRAAFRKFARLAGVYRDLGDPDEGQGTP